jgi:FSR family fosmidomycin resistance protein-like MFS transporter
VEGATAAIALPVRIDRRGIGLLAFGHLSVDLVQGAVPPLLPFLVSQRGYSYAAAGSLLLFSSLGSSLLQPLLGAVADRVRASWLMPAGTALAAVGIGLVALTDSYLATGGALLVASVGVAMYHPEAVRFAGYVSRASGRRGVGMSMFAVGGISGWALAPAIVTPAILIFGLPGVAAVAIIPAVASLLLLTQLSYVEQYRPARLSAEARAAAAVAEPSRWGAFTLAAGAATARTGVQFGLQAFVPLYLWRVLHTSQGSANLVGTSLLAAGAAGALLGGRIADRHGFRPLVLWSLVLAAPFVVALTFVPAPVVFVLMACIGLTMEANFYPLALAAQNAVPRHIGFSAGVTLGVSIGIGAGISALLGVLADAEGLRASLVAIAGIELVAFCLALGVPRKVYDPD